MSVSTTSAYFLPVGDGILWHTPVQYKTDIRDRNSHAKSDGTNQTSANKEKKYEREGKSVLETAANYNKIIFSHGYMENTELVNLPSAYSINTIII